MTTEVDLGKLVCIQDFEDAAEAILDLNAWEYYRSGSDAEITVKENKAAYLRLDRITGKFKDKIMAKHRGLVFVLDGL